jgi:hypothetical protein
MALNPVTYNWKTEAVGTDVHTGFIAQQVLPIFSNLVSMDSNGYYELNYAGFTPYIVSGLKQVVGALDITQALSGTSTLKSFYQGTSHAAITVDAVGQVGIGQTAPTSALDVSGVVTANDFVVADTGTASGQMPSEVLTASGAVDLYKVATYSIAGLQSVRADLNTLSIRVDSLETRLSRLENASTTVAAAPISATTSPSSFGEAVSSMSSVLLGDLGSALSSLSSGVHNALAATFGVFDKVFAREVHTDTLCVGSVCVTQEQFLKMVQSSTATSTPPTGGSTGGGSVPPPATSTPPGDTTAPVVTLVGDAAMQLTVADTFADPGATATDDVDGDLTNHINVSGTVDTTTAGVYTLTYSATDAAGTTGSISRTVTVIEPTP